MGSKTEVRVRSASDLEGLDDGHLLTPGEVAAIFRVDPKTVTRWAAGPNPRIASRRTLGGHRRFTVADVKKALEHGSTEASNNW